jgi:hypothetical protein
MMHSQFLRIKKLTGKGIIQTAAKHNHREIAAEFGVTKDSHIDPARIAQNLVLRGAGDAAGVAATAQSLMDLAGVKPLRKDAVRALEIIFGLPPASTIPHEAFFNDAVTWAERYFEAPVISAIIHNDEAAPHCHVLLLPLVRGRMIGSDLMGNKSKLQALQADFHTQVGQAYGLTRQAPQKRHSITIRRQALEAARATLEANSGLNDDVLGVLLEPHLQNPEPLMLALGLNMPKSAIKGTFAGIMTKPCKPDKPIGFGTYKPIGFADEMEQKKERTLSCVGFQNLPSDAMPDIAVDIAVEIAPNTEPANDQQTQTIEDDYQRQHDSANSSSYWDEVSGEFIKPPAKLSSKPNIKAAVNESLRSIGKPRSQPSRVMRC